MTGAPVNWTGHVYDYCERTSPAFWGEPLDALSNLAYLAAAGALWWALRRDEDVPASVGFMPGLAAVIGAGSFAFHTLATRWSKVLDVVPIGLFVLCYLACYMRWFYGLSWRRCLLGVAGFIGLTAVFGVTVAGFVPNRSGIYVPVLIVLAGLAAALALGRDADRSRHWPPLAGAAVVFAAALVARTIDRKVCASDPEGTHFIWHLLTGLLLYLVGLPLIRRWRSVAGTASAPPDEHPAATPAPAPAAGPTATTT